MCVKSIYILYVLLIALCLLSLGFYYGVNSTAAISILAGGGANAVGQIYFLLKMRLPKLALTPKMWLHYFYRAEILKLAIIFGLLAVLLKLFNLHLLAVFIGFVVIQCASSFTFYFINHG